jgi:hypothetical protein
VSENNPHFVGINKKTVQFKELKIEVSHLKLWIVTKYPGPLVLTNANTSGPQMKLLAFY